LIFEINPFYLLVNVLVLFITYENVWVAVNLRLVFITFSIWNINMVLIYLMKIVYSAFKGKSRKLFIMYVIVAVMLYITCLIIIIII